MYTVTPLLTNLCSVGIGAFTGLGNHVGFRVAIRHTRGRSKVSASLASLPRALEKNCAFSEGSLLSQLINCHYFTTGLKNSAFSSSSNSKSTNLQQNKYYLYNISVGLIKHSTTLTITVGTSRILISSVTVPTTTATLPSLPGFFICLTKRDNERGARLVRLMQRRRLMILLNFEWVRLAKNLYSLTIKRR